MDDKMNIQWYPGHMTKTRRQMEADLKLVDAVCEIVDALFGCRNCVVHVADEQKVVLEGLDGYIVAEKNGRLLVCRLTEEQRIKEFSQA